MNLLMLGKVADIKRISAELGLNETETQLVEGNSSRSHADEWEERWIYDTVLFER